MNPNKRSIALLTTTFLLLVGGNGAMAQLFPTTSVSLNFPTGGDRGAPARTGAGGVRREGCSSQPAATPLTALTPTNNIVKTVAVNPSIYIYVPAYEGKEALFRIIDKQAEEIIYETEISLSNFSGILKLDLPDTVQLESNITYEWGFFVECDPNDPIADEGIEGWIERAELTPEQESEIQQAAQSPLQQAQLYADAGIWNETLALLTQIRDSNPTVWAEFLESVGLTSEIANSPMISATSDRSSAISNQ